MAGSGLFMLLESEASLMRTVACLQPKKVESEFNALVNAAVRDYKATMAYIPKEGTIFDNEVWLNFNELFNLCVDIKKKEAVESAAEAAAAAAAIAAAPASVSAVAEAPASAPAAPLNPHPIAEHGPAPAKVSRKR